MDTQLRKFNEVLVQKGYRHSGQRDDVVRAFFASTSHIGIEELLRRVHRINPRVGIATVYRTLNLLVETDFAIRRDFVTGAATYERKTEAHHDHLLCTACGRIVEFSHPEIERLQDAVAENQGFTLQFHKMELYGLCKSCKGKSKTKRGK